MSENSTLLALIALGGTFLCATYLFYKKEWKTPTCISLVVAAFFFVMALPEKSEANQSELDGVQEETRQMQVKLRAAQEAIRAQQEKLSDMDQLLKAFYQAGTTKTYSTALDSDRLCILGHESNRITLYALLPDRPIPQTLQLQYHIYVQPRNSYSIDGNLITFRWSQSESRLREKPLEFTYVPDPTPGPKYEKLERHGHRAYADSKPLLHGYIRYDPVFEKLQNEAKSRGQTQIRTSLKELQAALEAEPLLPLTKKAIPPSGR